MDPCLTQPIPVSLPNWCKYSKMPSITGYSGLTTKLAILNTFLRQNPEEEGQLQAQDYFARTLEFNGSGDCLIETAAKKKIRAFCKVVHLLDPVRSLQGYYNDIERGERRIKAKMENPHNQAYIDSLANYLLSQLRENNLSPHFCRFYGSFQGVAGVYRYNISDSFDSYRKYRSFWRKKNTGLFTLYTEHEENKSLLNTPRSSLHSRSFSYSTTDSIESDSSHISLIGPVVQDTLDELESIANVSEEGSEHSSESDEGSTDSYDSEYEEPRIFSEFKDYPAVLIFQEKMDGVFDALLNDPEEVKYEEHWTAWTFQLITALCVAQGVLGLTHNDLHTNNILYKHTTQKWLYYKARDGTIWKIPTYGRILHIIDFGRAVFRVEDVWFCSDDFAKGGDAEGQYSFDTFKKPGQPTVYPNPSFDLSRYSVSIIDALFKLTPPEKENGMILSTEDNWVIRETVSPLWNLLWSWLIDDAGKNVLRSKDNVERFPSFDLYEHIGAHVHTAKPQEQLHKDIFKQYIVSEVPEDETVYPLFC